MRSAHSWRSAIPKLTATCSFKLRETTAWGVEKTVVGRTGQGQKTNYGDVAISLANPLTEEDISLSPLLTFEG